MATIDKVARPSGVAFQRGCTVEAKLFDYLSFHRVLGENTSCLAPAPAWRKYSCSQEWMSGKVPRVRGSVLLLESCVRVVTGGRLGLPSDVFKYDGLGLQIHHHCRLELLLGTDHSHLQTPVMASLPTLFLTQLTSSPNSK